MPIQNLSSWTDYLNCPICDRHFDVETKLPVSLGCGHTLCKTCLFNLPRSLCPYDQGLIEKDGPVNTALVLCIDSSANVEPFRSGNLKFDSSMKRLDSLAPFLKSDSGDSILLSRPVQRKLIVLLNCQLFEEEGRFKAVKAARSLGERSVGELLLLHQNPGQLSANLWAAVRGRGCQFLGPAMQEEVLKLVLLALQDGEALSRKVLVMYVVQRLEPQFPQASKTSIGHVVQLLYRASCFKVTKRDGDSSLMQLKEEFRTYDSLRREHDTQIVAIATEAGLRIAPDQWSSLLYGDNSHKSGMQSIIDKLQTSDSFSLSVQELVIALQKTGDPESLSSLSPYLDLLANISTTAPDSESSWTLLNDSLDAVKNVLTGLQSFLSQQCTSKRSPSSNQLLSSPSWELNNRNSRYKTSLCRDLSTYGSCPRGKNCTFAHSANELDQFRSLRRGKSKGERENEHKESPFRSRPSPFGGSGVLRAPIAQVAPLPRNGSSTQMLFASTELYNPLSSVYEDDPCSESTIATKSLSALKSRKEEIIEDLLGVDGAKVVSRSSVTSFSYEEDDVYSMWNTKSIASIVPSTAAAAAAAQHHAHALGQQEDDCSTLEISPLPDTPLVSRFGPISRRCNTFMRGGGGGGGGDARLFHQNGKSLATLTPISVGSNGEIGYILVPEQVIVGSSAPQAVLLAESERMKLELEALQQKISKLNEIGQIQLQPSSQFEFTTSKQNDDEFIRNEKLCSELILIENSIRDRERELSLNHHGTSFLSDSTPIFHSGLIGPIEDGGIVTMASSGCTSIIKGRHADFENSSS